MDTETLRRLAELQRVFGPIQRVFGPMQREFGPGFAAAYITAQKLLRLLPRNPYGIGPSPKIEPKWGVDTDPNIPGPFKAWYKRQMGSPEYRAKLQRLVDSLARSETPQALDCSLELNAACQFLDLAQKHHNWAFGPDIRGQLYQRIRELHHKVFGCYPSNLRRVLRNIGLSSLPYKHSPGRPRKRRT
jgi:hypothetical protein